MSAGTISEELMNCLEHLNTKIDAVESLICILHKIMNNILQHSHDPKYRRLKLSNKAVKKIYDNTHSQRIMHLAGFVLINEGDTDNSVSSFWEFPINTCTDNISIACALLGELITTHNTTEIASPPPPSPPMMTALIPSLQPMSMISGEGDEEGQTVLHKAAASCNLSRCGEIIATRPELIAVPDNNGW
jgi:hypothetical protein